MDTRGGPLRIAAILFMVMALCFPVFAGPTFIYGGHFNLQIPAAPDASKGWMDDAIIEVDRHATIYDIDVAITLTHSNVFDLQIFVQSPFGTRLCLNVYDFKNEFFKGEDYIRTIFDDEAESLIEQGDAPFTGRFRPKAPGMLEVFDGEDAYGLWRLQIYDMWHWDTGGLDRVELIVTVCEPTAATLLAFGIGLTALLRPRRK